MWSPDGSTIAFARHAGDGCKILLAPALGGSGTPGRHLLRRVRSIIFRGHRTRGISSRRRRPGRARTDMAITLVPIDGGPSERLAYEHGIADLDLDARYSPDGTPDRVPPRREPVQRSLRRRRERRRGAPADASGQPHARFRLDARWQRAGVFVGTRRTAGALHRFDR